jgi:hypothetical protein
MDMPASPSPEVEFCKSSKLAEVHTIEGRALRGVLPPWFRLWDLMLFIGGWCMDNAIASDENPMITYLLQRLHEVFDRPSISSPETSEKRYRPCLQTKSMTLCQSWCLLESGLMRKQFEMSGNFVGLMGKSRANLGEVVQFDGECLSSSGPGDL